MCGLAGQVRFDGGGADPALVARMTQAAKHRGPDSAVRVFADGSLALGHCRLAIQDLSDNGLQPFSYGGHYTIVFNGEIYNFRDLRLELQQAGHRFRTDCDTEVVVAAYQAWGEACTARFNGMWAFAIWDGLRRRLFCSRDRFGIRPFYYALAPGGLLFASEIGQLLASGRLARAEDDRAVFDFLYYTYTDHTERTFFRDVRQLRGGHNLTVEAGRVGVRRYYALNCEIDGRIPDPDGAAQQFRGLFLSALRCRLASDVPVGACLSGGLDSSTIVAAAHRENLPRFSGDVFTVAFPGYPGDETAYAAEVVARTGTNWHLTRPAQHEALRDLERLARVQEEPFTSLSVYAQYRLFHRAAQQGLHALLDGQGADEILLAYPYCLLDLLLAGRLREFGCVVRDARRYGHASPALLTAHAANLCLPVAVRDRILLRTWRRWIRADAARPYLEPHDHQDRGVLSHMGRRQLKAITVSVLPQLLRYMDRNGMAFAVEARLPFLDYRLVEFCVRLTVTERTRHSFYKGLMVRALGDLLPPAVRERRDKVAFRAPTVEWLSDRLGAELARRYGDAPLPPYVVRSRVRDPYARWRLYSYCLWKDVMGVA